MSQSAHDRNAEDLARRSFDMTRGPTIPMLIDAQRRELLEALSQQDENRIATAITAYVVAVKQFPHIGPQSSLPARIALDVGKHIFKSDPPSVILAAIDARLGS